MQYYFVHIFVAEFIWTYFPHRNAISFTACLWETIDSVKILPQALTKHTFICNIKIVICQTLQKLFYFVRKITDLYFFFQRSNMIDYISKMKWKFVILELKICNIEIVMSNLKNNFILWEIKFIKKNNFKVQILFFK